MTDAQQAVWTATYAAAVGGCLATLTDSASWPSNTVIEAVAGVARAAADLAVQHLNGALDTHGKRGGF